VNLHFQIQKRRRRRRWQLAAVSRSCPHSYKKVTMSTSISNDWWYHCQWISEKGDCTGTGTLSKFGCQEELCLSVCIIITPLAPLFFHVSELELQMRFNLQKTFPLLTTKVQTCPIPCTHSNLFSIKYCASLQVCCIAL
jgi:hypothetical protein